MKRPTGNTVSSGASAKPELRPDSPAALADVAAVSRETVDRLKIYVDLLKRWQPAQNLVAPSTLGEIWSRHVADSLQPHFLLPKARRWVDFGSGAGFPGLVTAILLMEAEGSEGVEPIVHLLESNQRKAAFLRTVIRDTGCPAKVHAKRIEDVLADWSESVDAVSARALASLSVLCGFAHPLVEKGAIAIFHKGKNFREEIIEASHAWELDLVEKKSLVDPDSRLLIISRISARSGTGKG
ncbi:16S rRNA (guanine(527)-N(7))-methyltransferase RsmG [Stappia sp. GBMRC 2046]|uniref:Ribosomal RNA small subunit methyltransferase G n=1 Tax=Stappia sediminis TaxID=2692190 RepID=A0A7X3LTH0_9HYPH|nr:16S rRNA (guanine(527)-N(7))-methyltransferase RsmG [Stappia sediminis]